MMALRVLMVLVVLFPIWFAVSASFMDLDELYMRPPRIIPSSFQLTYYADALHTAPLLRFLGNSLVMSVGIMLGQLVLCSLAAFAFAYFDFKGKNVIFMAMLATMMIPGESIVISNYMTIGDLGWYDTFQGLILPGTASAISVFFLRQAFLTVRVGEQALVCADCVGAGEGDHVLIATGGAARVAAGTAIPVDAAIVGIVDNL